MIKQMTTAEKRKFALGKVRDALHSAELIIDAILSDDQIDDANVNWSLCFRDVEWNLNEAERTLKTLKLKKNEPISDYDDYGAYVKESSDAQRIRRRLEATKTILEKFRLCRA